jgi:hypothetical protein
MIWTSKAASTQALNKFLQHKILLQTNILDSTCDVHFYFPKNECVLSVEKMYNIERDGKSIEMSRSDDRFSSIILWMSNEHHADEENYSSKKEHEWKFVRGKKTPINLDSMNSSDYHDVWGRE